MDGCHEARPEGAGEGTRPGTGCQLSHAGRATLEQALALPWEVSLSCPRDISQGPDSELSLHHIVSLRHGQHLQGNTTVMQLFHAPSSTISISFKSDLCLAMFGLQIS